MSHLRISHERQITLAEGEAAVVFRNDGRFELFMPSEGTVTEDSPAFAAGLTGYLFQADALPHFLILREEMIAGLNASARESDEPPLFPDPLPAVAEIINRAKKAT